MLITSVEAHVHIVLARVIDIAQVSNLTLSLLTNVIATSIIAAKSWCVRVRVAFALDLMLTCAIKEISQVYDELWCRWPCYNGKQSIGLSDRVRFTLYSDRGRFHISTRVPDDRVIINLSQIIVLVSIFIHLSFATLGDILLPVVVQLAVRTSLLNDPPTDFVDLISLGNLSNYRAHSRGPEQLVQVHNILFVRFHYYTKQRNSNFTLGTSKFRPRNGCFA